MAINAQVTNRAILFEPTGTVDCGQVPGLNDLESYTIQFWINPTQWTPGATILSRGDKFSAKLGAEGEVVFTFGEKSVSGKSDDLKAGEWNGVMLNCSHKTAKVFVNNVQVASERVDAIPDSEESLKLGGGYAGKLDEVRLWNCALKADFDYFTNNTLNKWAPQWDRLLVYYKMDQKDDVDVLIDYRFPDDPEQVWNNHGVMSEGVSRVDADNEKMPYLWNAAYTENSRFFDRTIPRDQYLLSNAVIILGSDVVLADGSIVTRTPNNHATEVTGTYMAEYEGRDGVIAFDGTQKMTCPAEVMPSGKTYAFETWVNLDEWTPGAYLFRRETEDQQNGIAVYLGDADGKRIFIRVNGNLFGTKENIIPVGEWTHFGFTTGSATSYTFAFSFSVNGTTSNCNTGAVEAANRSKDVVATGNDNCLVYVGEGLKGKLDETAFFFNVTPNLKSHMDRIPLPTLTSNATVSLINNGKAVYLYDDPANLGFSSLSQDAWLRTMQSAYDGYAGAKFYISVNGSGDNWYTVINTDAKRKRFAKDLAELSKNYDGVELDLEWVYNATGNSSWANFSLMADEINKELPEGKEFRISMHNVTYAYPKDKLDTTDGFTFQQYGPQPTHFNYNTFLSYCNAFVNYGFPKNKIVTSYSTTTSKGQQGSNQTPIKGIRDNFFADGYVPSDANVETKTIDGYTYSFMGPLQVYKRAKYTREQNFQGIFYWDMGNDYWLGTPADAQMPEYNSAKYCSFGINANVDPIMTGAKANHYDPERDANGIGEVVAEEPVEGNGITYNIMGMPVEHPTAPGVYIRDGKKFIVR